MSDRKSYPRIYTHMDSTDRPYSYLREQGAIVVGLRINTDTLQKDLANALGLRRPAVSEIETGIRDITLQEGFAIAAFFGVDVYALEVGGDESTRLRPQIDDTPRPARRATAYTKAQGEKLKRMRCDRGLRVTAIARELGVVDWVVYSIESGNRTLYLQEGFKLALLLKINIKELQVNS